MTLSEMIHRALHEKVKTLPDDNPTFTPEEITLAAWTMYPASFGLKGFEDKHPDHNRVVACLADKPGLIGRGLLEKVGVRRYRLTGVSPGKSKTDGQLEVARLNRTNAAVVLRQGRAGDLTTPDALTFFDCKNLRELPDAADAMERVLRGLRGDPSVPEYDVNFLQSVASALSPFVEKAVRLAGKKKAG